MPGRLFSGGRGEGGEQISLWENISPGECCNRCGSLKFVRFHCTRQALNNQIGSFQINFESPARIYCKLFTIQLSTSRGGFLGLIKLFFPSFFFFDAGKGGVQRPVELHKCNLYCRSSRGLCRTRSLTQIGNIHGPFAPSLCGLWIQLHNEVLEIPGSPVPRG